MHVNKISLQNGKSNSKFASVIKPAEHTKLLVQVQVSITMNDGYSGADQVCIIVNFEHLKDIELIFEFNGSLNAEKLCAMIIENFCETLDSSCIQEAVLKCIEKWSSKEFVI